MAVKSGQLFGRIWGLFFAARPCARRRWCEAWRHAARPPARRPRSRVPARIPARPGPPRRGRDAT